MIPFLGSTRQLTNSTGTVTLAKRYDNYVTRATRNKSDDVFQIFMNAYAMSIEPHTNYLVTLVIGKFAKVDIGHKKPAYVMIIVLEVCTALIYKGSFY